MDLEPLATIENSTGPVTVAVVEDDAHLRENLVEILNLDKSIRSVGTFASGEEALANLPRLRPSVVLMDVNLPGMDGAACVRALSGTMPETSFLMLTVRQDTETIFNALANGAIGYLLKPTRAAALLEAIHDARDGGAPMTGFIARRVVQSFNNASPQSPSDARLGARELEVLEFLSQGYSYKEIAARLNIGYGTVNTHVGRIYKKLHVQSRSQAVARYLRIR